MVSNYSEFAFQPNLVFEQGSEIILPIFVSGDTSNDLWAEFNYMLDENGDGNTNSIGYLASSQFSENPSSPNLLDFTFTVLDVGVWTFRNGVVQDFGNYYEDLYFELINPTDYSFVVEAASGPELISGPGVLPVLPEFDFTFDIVTLGEFVFSDLSGVNVVGLDTNADFLGYSITTLYDTQLQVDLVFDEWWNVNEGNYYFELFLEDSIGNDSSIYKTFSITDTPAQFSHPSNFTFGFDHNDKTNFTFDAFFIDNANDTPYAALEIYDDQGSVIQVDQLEVYPAQLFEDPEFGDFFADGQVVGDVDLSGLERGHYDATIFLITQEGINAGMVADVHSFVLDYEAPELLSNEEGLTLSLEDFSDGQNHLIDTLSFGDRSGLGISSIEMSDPAATSFDFRYTYTRTGFDEATGTQLFVIGVLVEDSEMADSGEHFYTINVRDNLGNVTSYEQSFVVESSEQDSLLDATISSRIDITLDNVPFSRAVRLITPATIYGDGVVDLDTVERVFISDDPNNLDEDIARRVISGRDYNRDGINDMRVYLGRSDLAYVANFDSEQLILSGEDANGQSFQAVLENGVDFDFV